MKMIKTILAFALLLIFAALAYSDVDCDGSYVTDWFNRPGPEMGSPDNINTDILWQGGADDILMPWRGKLKMSNDTWGNQTSVLLDADFGGWDASSDPEEVIQIDFKIDSLHLTQNYTYGPAFKTYCRNPSLWLPQVHFIHEADDVVGTYSLHVSHGTDYSIVYHDENGLVFGRWYRLTEKWSDITEKITYYLQDLDTPGIQTQIHQQDKKDSNNNWASGYLANSLSINIGRAVCEAEFNALLIGLEGTRPVEPNLACGVWGYLPGDFDENCYVNIADLAFISTEWLTCTNPIDPLCEQYPPPVYSDGAYFTDTFTRADGIVGGTTSDTGQAWAVIGGGSDCTISSYEMVSSTTTGEVAVPGTWTSSGGNETISFDLNVQSLTQNPSDPGGMGATVTMYSASYGFTAFSLTEEEASADSDFNFNICYSTGFGSGEIYETVSGLTKGHWYRVVMDYKDDETVDVYLQNLTENSDQSYIGAYPKSTTSGTGSVSPTNAVITIRGDATGQVHYDNIKAGQPTSSI